MEFNAKKISFGFSKITQKSNIIKKEDEPKKNVELIDCLEGKSIKVKE